MNVPTGSDAPGLKQDGFMLRILARKMRDWLSRFLDEDGSPPMECVPDAVHSGESSPNGGMLSSIAPLASQSFFEPAGPTAEWLRMVEEGAPELLLPPEEGGTPWEGLRTQPVEFARPAPSPDFLLSIPAEQAEPEEDRIDTAGTTSDKPVPQRPKTNTLPHLAREGFRPSTNEPAFIRASRPYPSSERAVRQDDGRTLPHPPVPAGRRTRLVAKQAVEEQVPRAKSAETPCVSRPDWARESQRREGSVEGTLLPLGSRSPVREPASRSRLSVDRLPANELACVIPAASRSLRAGRESKGVHRESISVGNRHRIAPSGPAEVLPHSTELAQLAPLAADKHAPVPSSPVDDQKKPNANLAYRFEETGPDGSKPRLPAGAGDPWPELPSDCFISSFESAHLVQRLEHQRVLDLEQQGGL